jgi:predicted glycosyltransferase
LEQGQLNEILKDALNNPLDAKHQLLMNGAERSAEFIKNLLMRIS